MQGKQAPKAQLEMFEEEEEEETQAPPKKKRGAKAENAFVEAE